MGAEVESPGELHEIPRVGADAVEGVDVLQHSRASLGSVADPQFVPVDDVVGTEDELTVERSQLVRARAERTLGDFLDKPRTPGRSVRLPQLEIVLAIAG